MDLKSILKTYGLNDKQAEVYLACLSLGGGTAQKISNATNLPRSTVYEIVDSLKEIGLVSSVFKKKIRYYTAENPQTLLNNTRDKATLLEQSLPNFLALYNNAGPKSSVRFYEGRKNLKVVFKEILNEADHFWAFSSAEDFVKTMGDDYVDFLKKRAVKKISAKVIMRESPAALAMQAKDSMELRQSKLTPPSYAHHSVVFIWNKKVAMLNIATDFNLLIIESEDASLFFKSTFEFMWNLLR